MWTYILHFCIFAAFGKFRNAFVHIRKFVINTYTIMKLSVLVCQCMVGTAEATKFSGLDFSSQINNKAKQYV